EVVLLGNVAYRIGQTIEFDPETMRVTNVPEANALLSKTYRQGWEVK
ncbi:MAG: gfo/Idh/MocA family oxidoreductase, partial [Planctomycetota bacterium]